MLLISEAHQLGSEFDLVLATTLQGRSFYICAALTTIYIPGEVHLPRSTPVAPSAADLRHRLRECRIRI